MLESWPRRRGRAGHQELVAVTPRSERSRVSLRMAARPVQDRGEAARKPTCTDSQPTLNPRLKLRLRATLTA